MPCVLPQCTDHLRPYLEPLTCPEFNRLALFGDFAHSQSALLSASCCLKEMHCKEEVKTVKI